MTTIIDSELGEIAVLRSSRSTRIRVRVTPNGKLRASVPPYVPLFLIRRFVKQSRDQLKQLLRQATPKVIWHDGMQIGKSHRLLVRQGAHFSLTRQGQQLIVTLSPKQTLDEPQVVEKLRPAIADLLRKEAKSYLPRRLAFLAQQYNCHYERVHFSHASSRWGSCSSSGTISLNIALMKLHLTLIDYVLIHELAHTKEMNHSKSFWKLVAQADPQYKLHVRALKHETPVL